MAHPSSSHHGDRHRSRERSSHHHHRTISSTTLLLVLSLILAVLAVMLSLPGGSSPLTGGAAGAPGEEKTSTSVLSYLNPKRAQQLIAREHTVAQREAEVARREAELLVGAPGGVVPQACAPCVPSTVYETVAAPAQTIVKEVIKEDSLTPPGWHSPRIDDIIDRELKVAERERDISKREEVVNRREHDASRRESWITEQLIRLGNAGEPAETVEEEYFYEPQGKRRPKIIQQQPQRELPPPVVLSETEIQYQTVTATATQTVTLPPPAGTRKVAFPAPESPVQMQTGSAPKTTSVDIIHEEYTHPEDEVVEEEEEYYAAVPPPSRGRAQQRPPQRWWGE
ncbi:hypothetical protein HDZ31DRAFT_82996 [Schizophyllum fasciatum]